MTSQNQFFEPGQFSSWFADPQVDPSARNNFAIIEASKNGYHQVVSLLLEDPRVEPSADYDAAIQKASRNGHEEVVSILAADPRVMFGR